MPGLGLMLVACSPLTYFTDIVRYSFTGAHYVPVPVDIAALAVFALAFPVDAVVGRQEDVPWIPTEKVHHEEGTRHRMETHP